MSGYTDLTKLESSRNCLRRIARHDEPQFSKDSIVNVMEKFVKTVKTMDDTILVPCRLMDCQVGDSTDIIQAPGKDSTANQLMLNSGALGKRANSKNVYEFLNSAELFNLYSMLNALKNELLWMGKGEEVSAAEEAELCESESKTENNSSELNQNINNHNTTANNIANNSKNHKITAVVKGHMRRPSTASVASTVSVSNLSDAESEISNENDSGVESEGNKSDNIPSGSSSSADSISSSEDVCTQKKPGQVDKATELAKRCKRHLNGLYQCLEQMTEAANYLTARYQSDIGPV